MPRWEADETSSFFTVSPVILRGRFTGTHALSQDQVNALFGDRSTILPEGLRRIDLMDRKPLKNSWDPDPAYHSRLAAGAPPGKPLP